MVDVIDILSTYTVGTPDFGHSDIWHFNFALKFLLSQTLKAGYLPFWSKDIGTGFPLLAEGQTGMFNLYNLIAFKFLSPVLAFNLGFITIFLTAALGTYLFCRAIKFSKLASFYGAVIFSFSGIFVVQMVHYNLIQAASFLPWFFFLTEKILQTSKKRWILALALALSQQIYSGFQQLVLITLIGIAIYLIVKIIREKNIKMFLPIFAALLLGGIFSLPQVLPTLELTLNSGRTTGVSIATLADFPFMPQNLLGFLNPYIFGDPRVGTYPRFSKDWGIFWESTVYLGIIPIILAVLAIIKFHSNKVIKSFLIILLIALILLLGKSTPLFFIFQIPPFSLFRVPARFIFLFVWTLAILAAFFLSQIKSKKIALLIVAISFIDLFRFDLTYHAIVDAKEWLKPPETVNILKKDPDWFRIYTVNPYAQWNTRFLTTDPKDKLFKTGWQDMTLYSNLRNSLDPNQNLYWGIAQTDYYVGISFRRIDLFKSLLSQGIVGNPDTQNLTISSESAKLLSFSSIKYLITPYKTQAETVTKPIEVSGDPNFYIYQVKNFRPHAYLTRNYNIAETIVDLQKKLLDPLSDSVTVEKIVAVAISDEPLISAKIQNSSDNEVTVLATASAQSLLILTDSYFPGWKAYLDSFETEIFPANVNQRAVIFPPGTHEVKFTYRPLKIF